MPGSKLYGCRHRYSCVEEQGARTSYTRAKSVPLSSTVVEGKKHNKMSEHTVRDGIERWENQDLVIPLAIAVRHWRTPDYVGAATPLVQPMIAAALAAAARDGWHADEPADFPTLFSRSRVRTTNTSWCWRITSVTIHLTRAVPGAVPFTGAVRRPRLIPHG